MWTTVPSSPSFTVNAILVARLVVLRRGHMLYYTLFSSESDIWLVELD